MKIHFGLLTVFIVGLSVCSQRIEAQIPGEPTSVPPQVTGPSVPWWTQLQQEIPLLGEGNWVVIADAGYPWQVAPGVETINTAQDAPKVLTLVLGELDKTPNLRPTAWTMAEMDLVQEADAKGIANYRDSVKKALQGRPAKTLPHDQIVSRVIEAGKTVHVLVLKTNTVFPYSTVFLEVHARSLSPAAEQHLRDSMKAVPAASPSASPKTAPKPKKHGAK